MNRLNNIAHDISSPDIYIYIWHDNSSPGIYGNHVLLKTNIQRNKAHPNTPTSYKVNILHIIIKLRPCRHIVNDD